MIAMRTPLSLLTIAGLTLCGTAHATPFVNSRQVVISYRAEATGQVERVRVWISPNSGREWTEQTEVRTSGGYASFTTPGDGCYGFYLILENQAGASAEIPAPGTRPHGTVCVDTTPPLLQLHGAEVSTATDGTCRACLRVTVIEEHLHEAGVRLFYRTSDDGTWRDGGSVIVNGPMAEWQVPPDFPPACVVKLVTVDLAGNRAMSEELRLTLPRPSPELESTAAPAADAHAAAPAVDPGPGPSGDGSVIVTGPQPTLAPELLAEQNALRDAALQYLAEGRLSLAEARLEDALEINPANPDLLVDLGTVLYRSERYTDATQRFRTALESSPQHRAAIEGLALVAATQKRYPDARQHLVRLLQAAPDSAVTWLRFGDVEARLGHRNGALQAWRKVIELVPADSDLARKAEHRLSTFGPEERRLARS